MRRGGGGVLSLQGAPLKTGGPSFAENRKFEPPGSRRLSAKYEILNSAKHEKQACLGNRYNGFGQLHMMGDDLSWVGPNSWRTEGTSWTDTYQVKPMGILSAPQLILD